MSGRATCFLGFAVALVGPWGSPAVARADTASAGASIAFVTLDCVFTVVNIGMLAGTAVDLKQDRPNRTLGWAALGTGAAGGVAGLGGLVTGAMMAGYDCTAADGCDGEDRMIRGIGAGFAILGALGTAMGIATLIVGVQDATRIVEPVRVLESLPRPVVLRDRRGDAVPGVAWSVGW